MQGDTSISRATWPCYFLLGIDLASYLRTTRCLLGYLHRQGRWAPFLYRERSGALLDCYLAFSFTKIVPFFYMGPKTIVFMLQVFSAILQFHHLPCLLFIFLLYLLIPMKELIGLLVIATVSDESNVERGTVRAIGGKGLLEIRWSQALMHRR